MAAIPKYHNKIPQYCKYPLSKNVRNGLTHGSRGYKSKIKVTLFWREGERRSNLFEYGCRRDHLFQDGETRGCPVSFSCILCLIPFRLTFSLNLKLTVFG